MAPGVWTAEEDAALLALVRRVAGKRPVWSVACQALPGRSWQQCRRRWSALERPRPKGEAPGAARVRTVPARLWKPEEVRELQAMWEKNVSYAQMSRVLSRTTGSVRNKCDVERSGWSATPPPADMGPPPSGQSPFGELGEVDLFAELVRLL
jgi:hypothetical protein